MSQIWRRFIRGQEPPTDCPFAGGELPPTPPSALRERTSSTSSSPAQSCPFSGHQADPDNPLARRRRVIILYEEYISLPQLQQVWENPVTERPELEPCFAAAMHGMELCFLLLAQFVADDRTYVAKRPRVELVSRDLERQCQLLQELVDGELEEILGPGVKPKTLTQDFPFEGCPPTTSESCRSPALELLERAIRQSLPGLSASEQASLRKVVRNVTNSYDSFFRNWSVRLGIEPQLADIRAAAGLPPIAAFTDTNKPSLHYSLLVRPEIVAETFTSTAWVHKEDYFFRTIHLGTECWAFVATRRLESARKLAGQGQWHNASARVLQAAHILGYLGEHVLMLTSMILKDYLELKVEIEGTSGEGSMQVKAFRGLVRDLYPPLKAAVLRLINVDPATADAGVEREALVHLYDHPYRHPELYAYAKALEAAESALLGGFYFSHFRLAINVIGVDAKGTMNRAVKALKATYETAVFPVLDCARSTLGQRMDDRLVHLKGRIMSRIETSSPRMHVA